MQIRYKNRPWPSQNSITKYLEFFLLVLFFLNFFFLTVFQSSPLWTPFYVIYHDFRTILIVHM